MKRKNLIVAGVIMAVCLLFASTASAGFYKAVIIKINPKVDGSTVIQFIPGAGEDRFIDIPARVTLDGTQPGANRVLAVLLTAFTLDKEVTLQIANDPTFAFQPLIAAAIDQ